MQQSALVLLSDFRRRSKRLGSGAGGADEVGHHLAIGAVAAVVGQHVGGHAADKLLIDELWREVRDVAEHQAVLDGVIAGAAVDAGRAIARGGAVEQIVRKRSTPVLLASAMPETSLRQIIVF